MQSIKVITCCFLGKFSQDKHFVWWSLAFTLPTVDLEVSEALKYFRHKRNNGFCLHCR